LAPISPQANSVKSQEESEGRKGKTGGLPAHTREVRLGGVVPQTTHDKEGFAIRDPAAATSSIFIMPASTGGISRAGSLPTIPCHRKTG
jgi:hypothetical protein